jgi:hypothetical protein
MTNRPAPSLRELRRRREVADDWITYASWTAIGTAVLGILFVLTIWLEDFGGTVDAVPILSTLVAQALVGYKLRDHRSHWAAWGLMATYLASAVISSIQVGLLSGLLVKLAIGYVYIRGFLAAIDYDDLTNKIAAATAAQGTQGDAA